jgi:hypothetical protein
VKILALASLVLLAPRADVRFERDGVRVGESVLRGGLLELQGAGGVTFLASGSSVEALATAVEVEVAPDRRLVLEPGLRVTREEAGYRVAAHADRKIRFEAGAERLLIAGPVRIATTAEGWKIGDASLAGVSLKAGLQQDDTKDNLDRMLQAKDRMATSPAKPTTKMPRLFRGDPMTGAQAADSLSVRTLIQVSPSGAP